ncbi:MAG: 3D domain-containing protein [Ectobacillus sp.]
MSVQMIPTLLVIAGFGGTTASVHNQYEEAKQQHQEVQKENEALNNQIKDLQQQKEIMQSSLQQKEQQLQEVQGQLQEAHREMENAAMALPSRSNASGAVRTLQMRATAYSADPAENGGTYNGKVLTKTGYNLTDNSDAKVIAVDPSVIPLGSTVWVEGYGYAKAIDTGSAIKGNRIDVFIADKQAGREWGVRNVQVKVLTEGH